MALFIEHPGTHATVQDLGRQGHRAKGVPVGGAADVVALQIANWLVGNDAGAAAIECALSGPVVRFDTDTTVSVCGGEVRGTAPWRPLRVARGEVLDLRPMIAGAYVYLAVAGGIDVPLVLGSRSTDARMGWGGFQGRPLQKGDVLPLGKPTRAASAGHATVHRSTLYRPAADPIRFVPGRQWDQFAAGNLTGLQFAVSSRSDRMGIRLTGAALHRTNDHELESAPVAPGAIQVPPEGQPVVLLADAQTIGGYPVIAHVIRADLPSVAQRRPGENVRFAEVTHEAAHAAAAEQQRVLALMRLGIADRIRH